MKHPKLVAANAALFDGNRSAAQRHLQEYLAEETPSADDAVLVQWLKAQVQMDGDAYRDKLKDLAELDPEHPYAQQARETLEMIATYSDKLAQYEPNETSRWRWPLRIAIVIVVIAAIGLVAVLLTNPGSEAPTVTPTPDVVTLFVQNADQSITLNNADGSAIGTLRIMQQARNIETVTSETDDEGNELFVNYETGVVGAQFFGLFVQFDCAQAFCFAPPEADISLRLDGLSGSTIGPDPSALAAEDPDLQLEPIAANISTEGWLIFMIPETSLPAALRLCTPVANPNEQPFCAEFEDF